MSCNWSSLIPGATSLSVFAIDKLGQVNYTIIGQLDIGLGGAN
jgi:hypothetical protein